MAAWFPLLPVGAGATPLASPPPSPGTGDERGHSPPPRHPSTTSPSSRPCSRGLRPPTSTSARALAGDVMVLGAGGKMGPSLARRVRRAFDAAGAPAPSARRRALLRARPRRCARARRGRADRRATCSIPAQSRPAAGRPERPLPRRAEVRLLGSARPHLGPERRRAVDRRPALPARAGSSSSRPATCTRSSRSAHPGSTETGSRRPGRRVRADLRRPRAGLRARLARAGHAGA